MTRLVRFSNNAVSRLAANITNASTTISLTPGDGAKFPVISGTQFFMATLIKSTGETEIVKVTARATDTLTVVRAAEPVGATQVAYAFSAGDRIEQRLTAKALSDELDRLDSGANIGATNKTANYTVQAADVSTLIRVDTTAGSITITLPEIASLADDFDIMVAKVTDNANAVNIVRAGSTDLINGATSYPVNNQWQSAWLIADRSTNTWTAINSGAATSSIAVDTFTGDGTAGPYTLSGDPMSKANTAVYLSGVYQQKATYTLSGTSLTMGGNVPVGVTVEVVWSRPLSIGRTDAGMVSYDGGTVQDVLDAVTGTNGAATVGYTPAGTGAIATTVQQRLQEHDSLVVGYFSTGTSGAAIIDAGVAQIQSGNWFRVRMGHNSDHGMTLNGKAIKVLDIYATEQSQWTIINSGSASKNNPKVNAYRTVCQNMLSADVEYLFRYVANLDVYEVAVTTVYKHVFIPCGFGKEITELQDALTFASQFRISSYMDPIYMNVDSGTSNYPLKGQISIAISSGTTASPITSVMSKTIRIGENNMNGIEIVNEKRYTNTMDIGGCVVDFQVTLGNDDIACFNVWKTDLAEVRGITFKFGGAFSVTGQCVIGYWNSQDRFKQCVIDITGATVNAGITAYGMCSSGAGETNQVEIRCPSNLTTGLTAIWIGHQISALTVTGKPQTIVRYTGSVNIYGLSAVDGGSTYAFFSDQAGELYLRSGSLSAQNLFWSGQTPNIKVSSAGFTLTIANRNNKWVNKTDGTGTMVIIPSLGRVTSGWTSLNTITITSGDTAVSLKDGQLNKLFISSGNADLITINLDVGNYTFAQTGENHVIELSIVKAGSGTISLDFNASGNILPSNAGGMVDLTNSEPIKLIYEPSVAKWLVLR